jgi:predicted nucleotidyltransferase
MKYGLNKATLESMIRIFEKYPEIQRVILYGSRAKGNFREGSDIDLSIKSKNIDLQKLFRIENDLDDLLLPYKIDISLFHHISNPDLREHIERVGVDIYKNEKLN